MLRSAGYRIPQYAIDDLRKEAMEEAMAEHGVPLLTHGEVTRAEVDIFDREARFAEEILGPLMQRMPKLRVVMEHITTAEGASLVRQFKDRMGATITPEAPAAITSPAKAFRLSIQGVAAPTMTGTRPAT